MNILKNLQGVKIRGINIEQYQCKKCNKELFPNNLIYNPIVLLDCGHAFHYLCFFTIQDYPNCPIQSNVNVEEIEITSKYTKIKQIKIAKKKFKN